MPLALVCAKVAMADIINAPTSKRRRRRKEKMDSVGYFIVQSITGDCVLVFVVQTCPTFTSRAKRFSVNGRKRWMNLKKGLVNFPFTAQSSARALFNIKFKTCSGFVQNWAFWLGSLTRFFAVGFHKSNTLSRG
jgi:hypothetical protein